ncbi:uncharacterized protein LOC121241456 [Juglans microcarpa x Juglans regia]|uniref:uncharacterized protein LOC121241456 n=1 Tax=Juglans microcarpa x Juglans regia TaxID=2249226 RepID=UPI001B7ED707|nr:uncharacterized protein LOC121241456 [Juglans microcarpa x Juglans regia]
METKSIALSAAVPVPELLHNRYNYAEWNIRMRTYLKGQNLWKDFIGDDEDENQNQNATAAASSHDDNDEDNDEDDDGENDNVENDDGENDNDDDEEEDTAAAINDPRGYMALHAIQISCGPQAFSKIKDLSVARDAWQTLKNWYQLADTGNIDSSYLQYEKLYKAVLRVNLTAVKDFLDSHDMMAVRKAITDKGETALHIAVTAGHAHIVQELVGRMSKKELGTLDKDGYTALMTAVAHGRYELVECMLCTCKGKKLIRIRDGRGGNLPVVMAIDFGQIKIARYLYPLTSLKDLEPADQSDRNGAKFVTRAIYTGNFGNSLLFVHYFRSFEILLAI